jgi:hypothetical protein
MNFKPKRIKERIEGAKKDPWRAYAVAATLKMRWPEIEPLIMKHPKIAFMYANHVLKGKRWKEAEPYIIQDPEWAFYYAQSVIKGRWLKAEPIIKQDPVHWNLYKHRFLRHEL